MTFKNMKIPVENNLGEIVVELERLGYVNNRKPMMCDRYIHTYNGQYGGFYTPLNHGEPTTLAELKEM